MGLPIPLLTPLLLVPLAALSAELPQGPPKSLPTSPAEVAAFLKSADEGEAWHQELTRRRGLGRNEHGTAINALRHGPFRKAGGLEDTEYKALVTRVAELDGQMKRKREAMTAAEKAGDKDERAALEIESQRLRAKKDAAQAEADALVVKRCLSLPDGKAAAEQVQLLAQKAREADAAVKAYWDHTLSGWRNIARMYRQKAPGTEFTKVRTITLAPPADADQRLATFAGRNEAAALGELAHRLFRSLDGKARGLEKPFALYRESRFAAALDAFRDYFLDKLAHLEKYGILPEAVITDAYAPLAPSVFPREWAEDAVRGIATMANRFVSRDELLRVEVGPPGAVNWTHLPPEPLNAQKQPQSLHLMRAFHLLERESDPNGLLCWLLEGYQATGDPRHLRRWAEYADDWALNVQRDLNALPASELEPETYQPSMALMWNVRWYHTLIPRVLAGFLTRLRAVVLTHPQAARELPAPTLARVLLVALEEYATPNILVARATRFNWNMMGLSFNVRNSLLLGEFKTGQWLGRETARTLQNHALFSIMPDGGYVEYSDEGHQGVWREFGGVAFDLLRKHRPAWFNELFEDEFRESLTDNGLFWLRHLKPDGCRHRDSYRFAGDAYVGRRLSPFAFASLDAQLPWLTEQDEPARMLTTVFGKGERGTPRHLSDVLPHLGEFILRGGWGKTDPFLYMHSGRIPNSNPDEDCNAFKLHNHGHHLLTAQPIYVDGRTQNMHFRHVDNVGAKTAFLTHSDGQPIQGRGHTDEHLDFAEGIYEGAYEDREGRTYWSPFHTGGYDMRRLQRSRGLPAVTDVQRHTRQVFFVRNPVCWIVVDRIRCDTQHDYEMPYELYTPVDKLDWLRRGKVAIPSADRRVTIDESSQTVRTDNPGYPRVTLHHFSSRPLRIGFDPKSHDLAHKDGGEIRDAENEWKTARSDLRDWLAFVRRTLVQWSGQGDQVLVTLITTASADADTSAAWQVTGDGTSFRARAPDGAAIQFDASPRPELHRAETVTAEADTLLLVRPKGGGAHGIVLGARSLQSGSHSVKLDCDSAAFSVSEGLTIRREIHAPIKPVTFGPNVNVFTDHTEVTMETETPGVEILYTLDGGEPALDSPRYTNPVRITQNTQVRAIAVRAGAKELHWPLDPGFATLPTRAVFTRQSPAPAAKPEATQPGLTWEYAEGQPFALVATSGFVPAQKAGATTKLFDVSMRQSGSAFITRYTGYLGVPADGVYTFHAPREFIIPDIDPGYDLRVIVDGKEWWPAMRRHALGTWSRALAKGPHRFQVIYTDTRTKPFKHETWMNWPNPAVLWKGEAPTLEVSGPSIERQAIPREWLRREE